MVPGEEEVWREMAPFLGFDEKEIELEKNGVLKIRNIHMN